MASWPAETATVASPTERTRRRAEWRAARRSRTKTRGGVLWIAVSAVVLAGVVFVNVAVLRLNLALDQASRERTKLRAENAALQSQLSSSLSSPRVQARAREEQHLTPADPASFGYIDLSR